MLVCRSPNSEESDTTAVRVTLCFMTKTFLLLLNYFCLLAFPLLSLPAWSGACYHCSRRFPVYRFVHFTFSSEFPVYPFVNLYV